MSIRHFSEKTKEFDVKMMKTEDNYSALHTGVSRTGNHEGSI